ncbi:ECF RNA polymerase sigma factor SigW [Flavobacteriaceae bacterium UJ101]|nr:ECF RNA polymerase sigma factor SigW [Flavobacteriaceae bacterium UJ101]
MYAPMVYQVSYGIVKREDEAQDICQETFIEAYKKIIEKDFEYSFGGWLKRVAINKSLNSIRKTKKIFFEEVEDLQEEEGEEIEKGISFEIIKKELDQLDEKYRIVIQLYLIEGYKHKEIAEMLQLPENTTRAQYVRGKRILKKKLNEFRGLYKEA